MNADKPAKANLDRIRGTLIGLAVGDAMGAPVEFMARGRFPEVTGMRAGGKFQLRAGEWTDDTAQALCLATSMIELNAFDLHDQMNRYLRWMTEGYLSSREKAFGIGQQTFRALIEYQKSGSLPKYDPTKKADGNGSLMRLAPVIMVFTGDPEILPEVAAASSTTTHPSPLCQESCAIFSLLVVKAYSCQTKTELLGYCTELAKTVNDQRLASVLKTFTRSVPKDDVPSSGFVLDTLAAALWAFTSSDSFADGLLLAVNLGNDADTVGAVYGQLAGAFYGFSQIPTCWIEQLSHRDLILLTTNKLLGNRPFRHSILAVLATDSS